MSRVSCPLVLWRPKHRSIIFMRTGPSQGFSSSRHTEQNCPLGVLGTETPKCRSKSHYAISGLRKSGLRKSGFRDLRVQGNTPLSISISKFQNIVTCSRVVLSGFHPLGFRDLRVQGNTALSILISEMPKYHNMSVYCPFRITPIGILGLASTKKLALRLF